MKDRIIKVALADDHGLLNDALAKIINSFEGYSVIIQAGNGSELIQQLQADNLPDLVILDINMPVMNGYETAEWLSTHYPAIFVLVLTMYDSELAMIRLLQLGVRGVFKKKMGADELLQAIRTTMETGYYFANNRLVALLQPVSPKITLANNIMLADN